MKSWHLFSLLSRAAGFGQTVPHAVCQTSVGGTSKGEASGNCCLMELVPAIASSFTTLIGLQESRAVWRKISPKVLEFVSQPR